MVNAPVSRRSPPPTFRVSCPRGSIEGEMAKSSRSVGDILAPAAMQLRLVSVGAESARGVSTVGRKDAIQ